MHLLSKVILLFPRSPSDFWVENFGMQLLTFLPKKKKKKSASSEALSLANIFHRQRKRRSRSGESPDFFSSPQQSSAAFNSSSTTKIPLLFQCFQPRSQTCFSGQRHSLFPAAGLGMGAGGSQPGCPCSVRICSSGHLYSQPVSLTSASP